MTYVPKQRLPFGIVKIIVLGRQFVTALAYIIKHFLVPLKTRPYLRNLVPPLNTS